MELLFFVLIQTVAIAMFDGAAAARKSKRALLDSIEGKTPSELDFKHWIYKVDGASRIIPVDCHQRPGLILVEGRVVGLF